MRTRHLQDELPPTAPRSGTDDGPDSAGYDPEREPVLIGSVLLATLADLARREAAAAAVSAVPAVPAQRAGRSAAGPGRATGP